MTDTPIIRAARALARHESGTDCYDGLDEAQQQTLQESVRVVMEAFTEPSNAMIEAGFNHMEANGYDPRFAWEAMIDAALSE